MTRIMYSLTLSNRSVLLGEAHRLEMLDLAVEDPWADVFLNVFGLPFTWVVGTVLHLDSRVRPEKSRPGRTALRTHLRLRL